MTSQRLAVFISSTGDLVAERTAIDTALRQLLIDGLRFEAWPSSPDAPIDECLRRVEESDAFVLVLGHRYGSELSNGLSYTHQEYRRACELQRPVFAFLVGTSHAEEKQAEFIAEVRRDRFTGRQCESIDALKAAVQNAFLQEFTRCFRQIHAPPLQPIAEAIIEHGPTPALPETAEATLRLLSELDAAGDDVAIHAIADDCERRFSDDVQIMQFVWAAEVNLGINGVQVDLSRVAKAIDLWSESLKSRPKHEAEIRYNVANALAVLDKLEAAVAQYKASVALLPEYPECWKNLGTAYVRLGDLEQARACLEKVLEIAPQFPQALYSLATLEIREQHDPEFALAWLNRVAITGVPAEMAASVQAWKAILQSRTGRLAEGIARAEESIALSPDSDWAWWAAARLYSLVRRQSREWLDNTIVFWPRYLARFPHVAEGWAEFAYCLIALDDFTGPREQHLEAIRALKKAIDLGIDDGGLVEDRIGHLHQANDDWELAEQYFRRAADKDKCRFGYCHGVSLLALQQYEKALPLLLRAASTYQPDGLSWFQVARCHEGRGDTDAAIAAYEKAASLDKSLADAHYNLGGVLWNSGDNDRAKEVWRQAVQRFPDYKCAAEVQHLISSSSPP